MATTNELPAEFSTAIPESWLAAPAERSPLFFPVFKEISLAVQTALRERAPGYFFSSSALIDPAIYYAVLLYVASPPFRPRSRTELTYDVVDPALMKTFFYQATRNLPPALEILNAAVVQAGRADLVKQLTPDLKHDAVKAATKIKRTRSLLHALLALEARLMLDLTHLAGLGALPARSRAPVIAKFYKTWDGHLRRLSAGYDLRVLSSALFEAATQALAGALQPENAVPPASE